MNTKYNSVNPGCDRQTNKKIHKYWDMIMTIKHCKLTGAPGGPCAPRLPSNPGNPVGPASPLGPGGPGSPGSPCKY